MFRYRVRAIVLTAGIICAFTVGWSPARSQELEIEEAAAEAVEEVEEVEEVEPAQGDPSAATTTENPDIPTDELELLVKPLTIEKLENEAAGWMVLLEAKALAISNAEIAVKRQNISIDQQEEAASELQKAKEALEEAEEAQAKVDPGTPEYEEVTKKVEEAKEELRKAEEAIEKAAAVQEELQKDEELQKALRKAERTGELDAAKETLDKAEKEREEIAPGSAEYERATEKIDKLKEAIATYEETREVKQTSIPDSPEFKQAVQDLEKAEEELKKAREAIDGVEPTEAEPQEQSSETIDEAAALLEETEIDIDGEEKVAGTPGVVDSEDNLEEQQEQLEEAAEQLQESADEESELKNQLVATVTELQSQQTAIIDRFNIILDQLEKKGGNGDVYRKYIEVVSGIQLDVTDTEGLAVRLISWAQSEEGGLRWAGNIGTFVGIVVASFIVSQIFGILFNQILMQFRNISGALRGFVITLIKRGGIIVGILLALTALEVSLGPIIALVGGASFVLAFALQSNLGHFASGLTLMFYRPFDVGDEVKIAGLWGWVDSIALASTRIKGFDGQIYTLPNGMVWGDIIENLTTGERRELGLQFRIGFDENLAQVQQLLIEIMKSHPGIFEEPAPSIMVWGFEEYYIDIELEGWTKTEEYWNVHQEVLCMIKERFDKEGIKLAAVPIHNIRFHEAVNRKVSQLLPEAPVEQVSEEASPVN
ncbi:MAG: mechanosensitive ion channel [Symploca sp. SIO2G7]|nr:mechanosensitive ion channel [Symploca sp. SIO2G7]